MQVRRDCKEMLNFQTLSSGRQYWEALGKHGFRYEDTLGDLLSMYRLLYAHPEL